MLETKENRGEELMIENYEFGRIVINGKTYREDLIILGSKIIENWWRKEGHSLSIEDLEEVLREKPDILVIGTGYNGLMRIPPETLNYLESKGIKVVSAKTREACRIHNELQGKGKKIATALHLTC